MGKRLIKCTTATLLTLLLVYGSTAAAKEVEYTIDYGDYTGVIKVEMMDVLSKETLPWTGEGYGIHYTLTFVVSEETIYHIGVGDNLLTVNNEDPILEDRWCKITVDDGRVFTPEYTDYYAGWSPARQELSRGVKTCGVFKQPIPEGITAGHTVTVEVWQRATTLQDVLQPQINCYYVVNPGVGDPSALVYVLVVFNDHLGKEVYLDESFYPSEASPDMVGQFTDVLVTDYYADPVKWAVENGITVGTSDTTFSPNDTCTTAQILTFLWRAYGCPEPTIKNPFSDVDGTDYYYKAALWAYQMGMVSGNTFYGDTACTRASTVMYLWQAAGEPEPTRASAFNDIADDANYRQAIAWAVEQGITYGTGDGLFSPDQICNRGQIVTFLYRNLG